jgi:ribitol-5-phosphate 2-dehydrogenase (NADP+) / D-ribitol-5-phosphate cytidylyltransferase
MNYAIILAGGEGTRFDENSIKFLSMLGGKRVLDHTLEAFNNNSSIDQIVLVLNSKYKNIINKYIDINKYSKILPIIEGGESRQESTFKALLYIYNTFDKKDKKTNVLIHDAVRPLVSGEVITEAIEKLKIYNAVNCAVPTTDTIIKVDKYKNIKKIPDRNSLMCGQTPQAFKLKYLLDCYRKIKKSGLKFEDFSDDCGIFKNIRPVDKIHVIEGKIDNIKITYPQDIFIADKLLQLKTNKIKNYNKNYKNLLCSKVIVMFGGNSGIGLEIQKECKKYGALISCYSRSLTNTNVSCFSDVKNCLESTIKKYKKIDYIINASGVLYVKPIDQSTTDEIEEQINTNFYGCINISRLAPTYLTANGGIIFFTSSSYTMGRKNYCVYSATKAAIVNLTQGLAEELYEKKIYVNAICPSRTNTPMRLKNFGLEKNLLDPKDVAVATISTMTSQRTGEIIKV